MNRKSTTYSHISLVTLIVILLIMFSLGFGGIATAESAPDFTGTKGILQKIDNIDLDAIRSQYFNQNVKLAQTASYSGERWVIVELEGDSLYTKYENSGFAYSSFTEYCNSIAAREVKDEIDAAHEAFLKKLDAKGISYKFKYSYSTLNNGVAIKVSASAYNEIKKLDGVSDIYYSERYAVPQVAVSNDTNVYTTGIYNSKDLDYHGEGMVVAILDTGLDYSHEAFSTMPENPAWTKQTVAEKMANASSRLYAKATVDEVYYNAKVPFAYDYADDDADVYPSYSTHGTHVAGIVAGKSEYVVNEETGEKFIGVAPEAQLVICKVFTDNLDSDSLGGADSIDILFAVSDCVELGVDVINMSLGSSAGFADEKSDTFTNEIYQKVKEAGISLVVAASNDYSSGFGGGNGTNLATNPDSGTVGSPSTYDAALSVASINGQKATYIQANQTTDQVAFITEASDGDGNELDFVNQLYELTGKAKGETLNFKYVVIGGVGRSSNYTARVKRELQNYDGYDGSIALIKRGDITFAEKVQNAIANGATACIIYNNLSGTIRMSLGEVYNPIPTCAITMDAGKVFVDNAERSIGSIQINSDFKAGPFMSDFSSWGPMPDLQLKPEISAHGGEITSAVPGGYDIYSGTSMAAPNMSGAIALLRQYLKSSGLSGKELNARINQVLMSTATIALNEEGNPYSPRKQGAGLASIANAINTESFITVCDNEGNVRDKTKIELYDDPSKTGVYQFEFVINNIKDINATYNPTVYVMTETLASDMKTVAEKAHMLNDSKIEYWVNDIAHEGTITVPANGTVTVKVSITLSQAARDYIDTSFKNGMYVEGFVSLKGENDTKVTIGLPYLAFYGDWTKAPLFDYSVYELAESQKDTGVPAEDKLVASAADTKPIGMYYDDKYILVLGSYLYEMADEDVKIYATNEKNAVSIYDTTGKRTIYELYMLYAGLLRGAAYMNVQITDSATGEVIYSERKENISKSYAAGGSNRGAAIMLELKPEEWNMRNNSTYVVSFKGELDYKGGENPDRNTFEFQFTVDYEAPQIMDYRIRYESYKENKKVKYRIYMDVDVYDNQYVQDVMPCYVRTDKDGVGYLTLVTEHPIPVYGQKGTTSTVSFEITDIYEDYVKTGKLRLAVEDYAMNQSTYKVSLDLAHQYPSTAIVTDEEERIVDTAKRGFNEDGSEYPIYELQLRPNELFAPIVTTTPDATMSQSLIWSVDEGSTYLITNKNELFALAKGNATVYLKEETDEAYAASAKIWARINVVVTGTALSAPVPDKIEFNPVLNSGNYVVNINELGAKLELNPGQTVQLIPSISPWYIQNVEYTWKTDTDSIISIDDVGNLTAIAKGEDYVTVTANVNGRELRKSVNVKVNDYYRIVNYTLYDYYGGPECVIPKDKNVMYIDEGCFQYNTELTKLVLPSTVTEIPKHAFKGCTNLKYVEIPSQCIVIGEAAFRDCESLETVKFGKFADRDGVIHDDYSGAITLGKYAFAGCKSLKTIENSLRITTASDAVFSGCTSLESIDISALRVTGRNLFAASTYVYVSSSGISDEKRNYGACINLTNVETTKFTNIGPNMFEGCTGLKKFEFKGSYLNEGAFNGCTSLYQFDFMNEESFTGIAANALAGTKIIEITLPSGKYSIDKNAFLGCESLSKIIIGENTELTGMEASPFANCKMLSTFEVAEKNAKYQVLNGALCSKDGTTLICVPVSTTTFELPAGITNIGDGAFSSSNIKTIDLSNVTSIGKYAFADCKSLTSVTLHNVSVIADGTFSGCRALTTADGLGSVVTVGKYAFANTGVKDISLASAIIIDDYAFENSSLQSIYAPGVQTIGKAAFRATNLTEASFGNATSIGEKAFSSTTKLKTAVFGAVVSMGDNVFISASNLESVTFGQGTKIIGAYAFYATPVKTVVLPDGVENIGDFAFAMCTNLESINLVDTKNIGYGAFYNATSLKSADLKTVEIIGSAAFANTALTQANLASAKEIGEQAFMSVETLTSVNFGALEYVGRYAFYNTRLEKVTLPETFSSTFYNYTWKEYDEKGREEGATIKTRKVYSFGAGAFACIPTLTEINVLGNGDIFTVDGVLYAKVPGGYEVMQYPSGKKAKSYTVIDGTVKVGDAAFEKAQKIDAVVLPYSVKTIGSYAFFDSTVTNYTFNSVEAPTLLSERVIPSSRDAVLVFLFGEDGENTLGSSIYYANFYDYVVKVIYADFFNESYQVKDFQLVATTPKNGKGYDTQVWTSFFSTIKTTDAIVKDENAHKAEEAIAEIEGEESAIEAATTIEQLDAISVKIAQAREAYNKITSDDQRALVEEKYASLLKIENAMRLARAKLGQPVKLEKLELASIPNKYRYVEGETFDPTGMVVKAIFEDKSEIVVTDYTLSKTKLEYGDRRIDISYVYAGQTYTVEVRVSVEKASDSVPDDANNTEKDNKAVIIAVSVVVPTVVIIGVAVAVVLILKKKKADKSQKQNIDEKADDDANEDQQ